MEKRESLRGLVEAGYAAHYARQPVRSALIAKYAMVQTGAGAVSLAQASVEELVALRLAPELRAGDEAGMILERATVAAKKALRADGKSFVVKDGVNPLTAKIQPVVDALNAPAADGLEAALAACGIQIANQDQARAALAAKVPAWRDAILNGEVAPNAQTPYLNALKVGLGIKDYNLMIDAYNNGTGR